MKESAETFHWPVRIYYEDTDAGGVVYHSNYLNFFERARTEWLRHQGICQRELLEQAIGFVVRRLEIDYLKGAKLDQELTVVSRVSERKRASLTFCQELVNPQGELLCRAMVQVACINTNKMKPMAVPSQMFSENMQ